MSRVLMLCAALTVLAGCMPDVLRRVAPDLAPAAAGALPFAMPQKGDTLLSVVIPSRGATALLAHVGSNQGVETWMSADRITVSVEQGVVVATRGLGHDLMAGDAKNTLAAISGAQTGVYRRQMRYLTADNHTTYVTAGCSMSSPGSDNVQGRMLRRFEESCQARNSKFTNRYWVDGSGKVLASEFWVSPQIGSVIVAYSVL